jgi:hypothetical protein
MPTTHAVSVLRSSRMPRRLRRLALRLAHQARCDMPYPCCNMSHSVATRCYYAATSVVRACVHERTYARSARQGYAEATLLSRQHTQRRVVIIQPSTLLSSSRSEGWHRTHDYHPHDSLKCVATRNVAVTEYRVAARCTARATRCTMTQHAARCTVCNMVALQT